MTREAVDRLREEASARIETDPQGALLRYQRLLKTDPADIDSWASCSSLHLRLGQTEAAADGFARVLRLAERANSPEWVNYAQRSLAHLRQIAPAPPNANGTSRSRDASFAASTQARGGTAENDRPHPISRADVSVSAKSGATAQAIASASLAIVAGIGFLLLVTTGAVSQLWHYPFVRAALLRTIDDLTAATLLGYLGSILLQKAWSRYLVGRLLIYLGAAVLLTGAAWMTLSGLFPLSSLFAECTNIEDIKPACNIQIEELEKMTPESRKQLDVL